MCALVTAAECSEDVAGFKRGRCAGAAGGQRNILEGHEKGLSLNVGKRDVHASWVMAFAVTIECGVLEGEKTFEKTVRETADPLGVILYLVSCILRTGENNKLLSVVTHNPCTCVNMARRRPEAA